MYSFHQLDQENWSESYTSAYWNKPAADESWYICMHEESIVHALL